MINSYRVFCEQQKNVPFFSKAWWLDTVCGKDNWDVALVEKGGEIFASFPFYRNQSRLFKIITMPLLTQTMGPYIQYPTGKKNHKKLAWENKMMLSLIEQLPKQDYFTQNFHHHITNWLPFYWAGYQQSTRYTYLIKDTTLEGVEGAMDGDVKRRIKKAGQVGLHVVESSNIDLFYLLNKKTFARQNEKIPYSLGFVKHIYKVCQEKGACKLYIAENAEGEASAAAFFVYDETTVYYLMGGIDPEKKDLGGMNVVLYEGIKFALNSGRIFDFEGSMIKGIEKYFRSFGAIQTPYFSITKTNSRLFKLKQFIS